jgi:hypothetical protein
MKRFFKLWFLPVILLTSIGGMLVVDVPPKFTYYVPKKDQPVSENKLLTIYLEVKRKIDYALDKPINTSALSGAVIGWIICKILDSGFAIFKRRIKKE